MMRCIALCLLSVLTLSVTAQVYDEVSTTNGLSFSVSASSYMGGGTAIFDFNNDGLEDIYMTGCLGLDALFKNMGNGQFSNVTATAGLLETTNRNTTGVVTGDIDNDGDRDIFVTTWRNVNAPGFAQNFLFRNNGDETFTDITTEAGLTEAVFSLSATFVDLNLDGFLDLYVGNYVEETGFITVDGVIMGFDHTCFDDLFYLNNGDGTFTSLAESAGINNDGCALAMAATDYDRDGDPDIMVANDFGEFIHPNKLYSNNFPQLSCTDVAPSTGADIGMYAMGVATGDYDEDLDLDYYLTNLGANAFLHNDGGTFTNIAASMGMDNESADGLLFTSWGTFFQDLDNDTYLDLFVANGHIPTVEFIDNHTDDPNLYYHNNGDGTFTETGEDAGLASIQMGRGCAYGDWNNDGQLDIVVMNLNNGVITETAAVKVFQNQGNNNHWIGFTLEGVTSNRDAFGAQVELHAGGRIFLRELQGGGGCHASQSSNRIYFGLGDLDTADSLVVYWPGGDPEVFHDLQVDEKQHFIQGMANHISEISRGNEIVVFPQPAREILNVRLEGSFHPERWVIRDMTGREVLQGMWPQGQMNCSIHLANALPNGAYVLELSGAGTSRFEPWLLSR
ncbi:MAG: VCBS repeat-containing protein [Flavobacteriales bacterium]|nr:VCBS repeat-containing protein [Flavobacteriales bacterium]